MGKWFDESFLPSVFNSQPKWLSRKQTAICTENMRRETVATSSKYGETVRHDNYFYRWNGRDVILSYSKLNGCGSISFGLNAGEQAKAEKESKEEREKILTERIDRIKNNPERLAKKLSDVNSLVENYKDCLNDEGLNKDEITYYTNEIVKLENERKQYTREG